MGSKKIFLLSFVFVLMLGISHADLMDGLLYYYPLDETSGNTVINAHSGDYNMTNYGGVRTAGKLNNAIRFDGSNNSDYIELFPVQTKAQTFNAWIKYNNSIIPTVVLAGSICGSTDIIFTYKQGGDNGYAYPQIIIGSSHISSTIKIDNFSKWYMLTYTWDGTTDTNGMKVYIDGNLAGQGTATVSSISSGNVRVGYNPCYSSSIYNSDIIVDELGYWNRALTQTEITQLYANGIGLTYPFTASTFNVLDSVNLTHVKNVSADCNIDIMDFSNQPSPIQVNIVPNATFSCVFSTSSNDTNSVIGTLTDGGEYTVLIDDTTAPTIGTIDFNDGFVFYNDLIQGSGLISVEISDAGSDVNYSTCEFTSDGTNWEPADGNSTHCYKNYTITDEREYEFNFRVKDNRDNLGTGTSVTYFGDITPPITTFTFNQNPMTTDANISLTCTDNNAGCKDTFYKINDGNWIKLTTNPFSTTLPSGINTIQYYSVDNVNGTEEIKTTDFNIYGFGKFRFFIENTSTDLNAVDYEISPSINGLSNGTTTNNTLDLNLQGIPTTTYTISFSKENYSTRFFQIDLNEFSIFDVNFALISDSTDTNVPFKVYKTDETTIFYNTYVEIQEVDTNHTIGRLKTNDTGEVTFNLKADDVNYKAIINNGEFVYFPVALTVYYPKNEETLSTISETWKMEITQNVYALYTDLSANKVIFLLPDTAKPFNLKISDMNGNYFSRIYAKRYPGNPSSDTLQPYLVSVSTGLLTTVRTINGFTNVPEPAITLKIYKYIAGLGKTYVEEVVTDGKGEALLMLVINSDYEIEAYKETNFLGKYELKATSNIFYLKISHSIQTTTPYKSILYNTTFIPNNTLLSRNDKQLIQKINIIDKNSDVNISKIRIEVFNVSPTTKNKVYEKIISYTNQSEIINYIDYNAKNNTLDGNLINNEQNLAFVVTIETSDKNYVVTQIYKPYSALDWVTALNQGVKGLVGCGENLDEYGNINNNIPCPGLILIALFISLLGTVSLMYSIGYINLTGLSIMFLLLSALFVYFGWIPPILFAIMIIISFAILSAKRGIFS